MASVEEAQEVLEALGMPPPQRNRMAGLTLLALCRLKPGSPWSKANRKRCTVTKGVMDFLRKHHGTEYAPNTRETFRRQVLHQFVLAGIAEFNAFEPELPTNSPRAHYALTPSALKAIRAFGGDGWGMRRHSSGSAVRVCAFEPPRKRAFLELRHNVRLNGLGAAVPAWRQGWRGRSEPATQCPGLDNMASAFAQAATE